jgi:hypothetical protein
MVKTLINNFNERKAQFFVPVSLVFTRKNFHIVSDVKIRLTDCMTQMPEFLLRPFFYVLTNSQKDPGSFKKGDCLVLTLTKKWMKMDFCKSLSSKKVTPKSFVMKIVISLELQSIKIIVFQYNFAVSRNHRSSFWQC